MLRAAVTVVVVVCAARQAHAEPSSLAKARTAVDNLDYLTAKTSLADALAAGTASPDDLADIYRLTGIVAGALGDTAAATDAFQHWLALVPKATLPAGTSPKITRPFAAASKFFETHEPLHVKADTSADDPSVTLVVTSDPLGMIARARVMVIADHAAERTLDGAGGDKIKLPHGKRLDLRISALDAHGNHVVELGSADVPIVITGATEKPQPVVVAHHDAPPPPPPPATPRPLWKSWWLYAGVSVALLGTGTFFGYEALQAKNDLDALNAHSLEHSFDQAKSVESGGKRDALIANITWSAGGAVAAVAIVLYLTQPKMETNVAAVPVPGGGALVLGGQF